MANTPQAKKRVRQAEKRRQHNVGLRSMFRTHIKKVVQAIDSKDSDAAQKAYQEALPIIDRMAGKGIIHKNKARKESKNIIIE